MILVTPVAIFYIIQKRVEEQLEANLKQLSQEQGKQLEANLKQQNEEQGQQLIAKLKLQSEEYSKQLREQSIENNKQLQQLAAEIDHKSKETSRRLESRLQEQMTSYCFVPSKEGRIFNFYRTIFQSLTNGYNRIILPLILPNASIW